MKMLLPKGRYTLVDDEDIGRLRGYSWYLSTQGYVVAGVWDKGKKRNVFVRMHRLIMDAPSDKLVDHANGDRADNRKANLRLCGKRENAQNSKPRRDNATGVKGVQRIPNRSAYSAIIKIDGKAKWLGYYKTVAEAKEAYDRAAKIHFREFAYADA